MRIPKWRTKRPFITLAPFVLLFIFVVSLVGSLIIGPAAGDGKEKTIASYKQTGSFTLQPYGNHQNAAETIFPPITENMTMNFAYVLARDEATKAEPSEKTVSVRAVLSEVNGKWQKEVLQTDEVKKRSDKMEISFPLDFGNILATGAQIERDLNPRYNSQIEYFMDNTYRLDIIATVTDGKETLVASVGGKLNSSVFEIEDQLSGAHRGEGCWALYGFGYDAQIRENALISVSKISKKAETEKPEPVEKGAFSVTQGENAADLIFLYDLTSDKEIGNVKISGTVEVEGTSLDRWQKVILSKNLQFDSAEGKMVIPLNSEDIKTAVNLLDSADHRPSMSVDLKVKAKLHLEASVAEANVSDEFLSESLTGKLEGGKIVWNTGPEVEKQGAVKETEKTRAGWLTGLYEAFIVLMYISLPASVILLLVGVFLKKKPASNETSKECLLKQKERELTKKSYRRSLEDISAQWTGPRQYEHSMEALEGVASDEGAAVHFYMDSFDENRICYWVYGLKVLYLFDAKRK
ncbi:MAG: hypothetical protein WC565_02700 [Parcubacteria group bacterium]